MLCMSKTSEMVFAAFTQHCMQSTDSCRRCQRYSLCIQWPLAPPGGKARCSHTVRPVGLAVHHHAVRGGSFVFKCSGTCQTTRVIAGKMHSQSPILKWYGGAQQPSNSYETMKSYILHTLTEPARNNLEFRQLQCLKCGGL